jgi:hypothetical protein
LESLARKTGYVVKFPEGNLTPFKQALGAYRWGLGRALGLRKSAAAKDLRLNAKVGAIDHVDHHPLGEFRRSLAPLVGDSIDVVHDASRGSGEQRARSGETNRKQGSLLVVFAQMPIRFAAE